MLQTKWGDAMAVTIGSVTEGNANAEEIKNNSPDSELYENNKKYLQGSLVKFNDKIYLAKRNVPSDVDLDNPYYWEIFMDAADSKRVDELFEKTGNLDELETESKDNLVAAINEAAASDGADWNQNNPTAKDYVKNRTHYRSVREETATAEAGTEIKLTNAIPFDSGEVVNITVNGDKKSLVAASDVLPEVGVTVAYVGDPLSSITSGAAMAYGWSVFSVNNICIAIAFDKDYTFGYMTYAYTRLPIEYSPIIVETDISPFSEFVPVAKIKINDSASRGDKISIIANNDDQGNAEIEVSGEFNEFEYLDCIWFPGNKYVVRNDLSIFIIERKTLGYTIKKYLNTWLRKNVIFEWVIIDGIQYSALLHGFERGLSGTFCTVDAHLYSVVVDFGSKVQSEWFNQDWKLTIKKIL